jgi:hypothetical protein
VDANRVMAWRLPHIGDYSEEHRVGFAGKQRYAQVHTPEFRPLLMPLDRSFPTLGLQTRCGRSLREKRGAPGRATWPGCSGTCPPLAWKKPCSPLTARRASGAFRSPEGSRRFPHPPFTPRKRTSSVSACLHPTRMPTTDSRNGWRSTRTGTRNARYSRRRRRWTGPRVSSSERSD